MYSIVVDVWSRSMKHTLVWPNNNTTSCVSMDGYERVCAPFLKVSRKSARSDEQHPHAVRLGPRFPEMLVRLRSPCGKRNRRSTRFFAAHRWCARRATTRHTESRGRWLQQTSNQPPFMLRVLCVSRTQHSIDTVLAVLYCIANYRQMPKTVKHVIN